MFKSDSDSKAWEELYIRFMPLVFGVCMNLLKSKQKSEDLAMHLFQVLPDHLMKYEIKFFKSWLFTITKNQCYAYLKKEKSEGVNAFEFMIDVAEDEESEEKPLKGLNHCLNKLNEDQKNCVELFYYEQKSYQEIVEISGLTLSKVKSHIQNGKRNLKNCIES